VSYYRIPWGPSTYLLLTVFLGSFVPYLQSWVSDGTWNWPALYVAVGSAVAAAISRVFQVYVVSKDQAIAPEVAE
jgi:hypothetical protein